jgi:hypothetical protein
MRADDFLSDSAAVSSTSADDFLDAAPAAPAKKSMLARLFSGVDYASPIAPAINPIAEPTPPTLAPIATPNFLRAAIDAFKASEKPLVGPGRLLDAFTGIAQAERDAKSKASVLDRVQPVTGYDAPSLQALSNLPRLQQGINQQITQGAQPSMSARTPTISPTGGIGEASALIPGNLVRSIGSSALKGLAITPDLLAPVFPENTAGQLRSLAGGLDRSISGRNLGISDQPMLRTGTALDQLSLSPRDVSKYVPEGLKQLAEMVAFGPHAIVADAGIQGFDKARADGLGLLTSTLSGGSQALTEGVPEAWGAKFAIHALDKVPMRALMSGDAKTLTLAIQQSARAAGVEFGTEELSSVGNYIADRIFADPSATPERLRQDMIDAFKATLVQAPTMIAGGKGLQAGRDALLRQLPGPGPQIPAEATALPPPPPAPAVAPPAQLQPPPAATPSPGFGGAASQLARALGIDAQTIADADTVAPRQQDRIDRSASAPAPAGTAGAITPQSVQALMESLGLAAPQTPDVAQAQTDRAQAATENIAPLPVAPESDVAPEPLVMDHAPAPVRADDFLDDVAPVQVEPAPAAIENVALQSPQQRFDARPPNPDMPGIVDAMQQDIAGRVAQDELPPRYGVGHVDMAEGGKPFQSKTSADKARKLQPAMRVMRVEGGYVLADKSDKQMAAHEAAARRLALPKVGTPGQPYAVHEFIASEGGLNPVARSDLTRRGNVRIGNRWLYAKPGEGLTMEHALERLVEEDFLPADASHDDMRRLILRSLTTPQYSTDGWERMGEIEQEAARLAYEDAQMEEALQAAKDAQYVDEGYLAFFEGLDDGELDRQFPDATMNADDWEILNKDWHDLQATERGGSQSTEQPGQTAAGRAPPGAGPGDSAPGERAPRGNRPAADQNSAGVGLQGAEAGQQGVAAAPADVAARLDELLHAPIRATGRPRFQFGTQQEARDFSRGFQSAVDGAPMPQQLPASHGIAQKYQDALHNGWSQGMLWLRERASKASAPAAPAAPALDLTRQSNQDIIDQQARDAKLAKDAAKAEKDAEPKAKKDREDAEIRSVQVEAAGRFELGGNAADELSGQGGMFDRPAPPAPPTAPKETRAAKAARLEAEMMAALGELGDIISEPGKSRITPAQEEKLLPVLGKLLRVAFDMGYMKFKDAAKYALDRIRKLLGNDMADALTVDHLQGAYISAISGKPGADSKRAVIDVENKGDIEAHTAVAQEDPQDQQEPTHAPAADLNLERDSQKPKSPADGAVQDTVRAAGPEIRQGSGATGGQAGGDSGGGQQDSAGVPAGGAAPFGESGDLRVHRGDGQRELADITTGADFNQRGADIGVTGVPLERVPANQVTQLAETGNDQARPSSRHVTTGDLASIQATLPQLLPGQQEDVQKAEQRFDKPDGYGMLFTNGTGTGKTFSGLGVAKRFALQGKKNILIVVPDTKIASDWVDAGQLLGLPINQLASTQDAGRDVVLTTYANLGDNDALAGRQWDLVIADEAHKLMQNADGEATSALHNLRALTYHPDSAMTRYSMVNRADIAEFARIGTELKNAIARVASPATSAAEASKYEKLSDTLDEQLNSLRKKLDLKRKAMNSEVRTKQGAARPRLVALSATPFAYEKTIDWGNGYLFDYQAGYPYNENSTVYNQPSPREYYFMTRLGYTMRTGKLNQPDAKVDSSLLQRQFNSELKKAGSLSGRMLDVPFDYDRRFVLVDSSIGNKIDEAMEWLQNKAGDAREAEKLKPVGEQDRGMSALRDAIADQFDYLTKRYTLEAIKAKEAVGIVKQHLALGRKVVVFHDYKKGGGINPFDLEPRAGASEMGLQADVVESNRAKVANFNQANTQFRSAFPELIAGLNDLRSPIELFSKALPGTMFINGDQKKPDLLASYKRFQDDASGPQVVLVQSAKNAGWSGHDTTGKHQRVLINLGQPTAPTLAIQQEGRIYRTGQASNAIMRYLNTGTSWERWTFATTIAGRASTAENLGMGELSRALKDSFVDAFEESDTYAPGHEGEGTGGKERDKAANQAVSEYDRAKTHYWATTKKNSRTKAQEGVDYFATPEPIGFKMVEWLDMRPGERGLEPSAGHGAIARWLPGLGGHTVIEPALGLRGRLALVMDVTKDRIEAGSFEDHSIVNKYDGVAMNPPFGTAGRTAIDHVAKAALHLRDGARIVALIPVGSADAKFDKWFNEPIQKAAKPLGGHATLGPIYKGDTLTIGRFGESYTFVVEHLDGAASGPQYVRAKGVSKDMAVNVRAVEAIAPGARLGDSYSPTEDLFLIASIKLPSVAFGRAGTGVMTRIVVLEKQTDKSAAIPAQRNIDLTHIDDINTLFDRLEDMGLAPRSKPAEVEAEPAKPAKAEDPAKPTKPTKPAKAAPAVVGGTVMLGGKSYPVETYTTDGGKVKTGAWVETKEIATQFSRFAFKKNKAGNQWWVGEHGFPAGSQPLASTLNGPVFAWFARLGNDKGTPKGGMADAMGLLNISKKPELIEDAGLSAFTPAALDTATGAVHFNPAFKLNRAQWAQVMAEELMHAVDIVGPGTSMSSTSNRLAKTGDITQEARQVFDSGRGLADFLSYPLAKSYGLSADRQAAELFARLAVLYHGDPSRMKRELPTAYEAYHDLFGTTVFSTESRVLRHVPARAGPGGTGGGDQRAGAATDGGAGAGRRGEATNSGLDALRDRVADIFSADRSGGLIKDKALQATAPRAGSALTPQPWYVAEPGAGDNFIRAIQDNKIDVKRVRDALAAQFGALSERADVYLNEELYHGRVASRIEVLHRDTIEPMLKKIAVAGKNAGITVDDVNSYLHARHAQERNQAMADINPGMVDNDALSGMSNSEALQIRRDFIANGKIDGLRVIANDVDGLLADMRTALVADGLEEPGTIAAWEAAYRHYVPLQREIGSSGTPKGQGISVRGPESKRAVGSQREVVNILANIVTQAETATIRAEKALVGRSLLAMARQYPNPQFWKVDQVPVKPRINPETGLVERMALDPMYQTADNVVMVKDYGGEHFVVFNKDNERAMLTARALKNLDIAPMNKILQWANTGTRFIASLLTQRNPVFWLTNLSRDLQSVLINIESTDAQSLQAQVTANLPKAYKGMRELKRGTGAGQWARYAREMEEAGGTTGYMQAFGDSDERMKDIKKIVKQMEQGQADPRRLARTALDFIDDYNDIIENGTRLAVFQAARDGGVSTLKAAGIAKNITVNFNRKGNLSPPINALYMFFNASVQGTARMLQALGTSRKAQAVVGVIGAMGFLLDMINRMMAGDDDETGRNRYDMIPEYTKAKNWIFMNPLREGEYVMVPLPLGPHVFHNAGRLMSDAIFRKNPRNAAEYGWALASVAFDAFSPTGAVPSLGQLIAPSVLDPAMQLSENKGFTGGPIYRSADTGFGHTDPKPAYTRHFENTPDLWKTASKALNDITGGDADKPGFVNLEPDILGHVFYSITGGPGRTAMQVLDASQSKARGAETSVNRLPLVSRFYGANDDRQRDKVFYDDRKTIIDAKNERDYFVKVGRRELALQVETDLGDGDPSKGRAKMAEFASAGKDISRINKQIRAAMTKAEGGEDQADKLKALRQKRSDAMGRAVRDKAAVE